MKKKTYKVPSHIEPKIEAILEKRQIPFEVAITSRRGILEVIPDWSGLSIEDIRNISHRIENLISKELMKGDQKC